MDKDEDIAEDIKGDPWNEASQLPRLHATHALTFATTLCHYHIFDHRESFTTCLKVTLRMYRGNPGRNIKIDRISLA